MIEAAYDRNSSAFRTLFADSVFVYYLVTAGAIRRPERRKVRDDVFYRGTTGIFLESADVESFPRDLR